MKLEKDGQEYEVAETEVQSARLLLQELNAIHVDPSVPGVDYKELENDLDQWLFERHFERCKPSDPERFLILWSHVGEPDWEVFDQLEPDEEA